MAVDLTLRMADGVDLDVRGEPGSTLGAALQQLGGAFAGAACWAGTRRLTADDPLGSPGLSTGDIVSVGRPGTPAEDRGAVLQILGVGGPAGGAIAALRSGLHVIGRGPGADLALPDPDVSRRHATLTVTSRGVTVHDLGSANGTYIDGEPVLDDGAELTQGQLLTCGSCVLALAALPDPPAVERLDGAGRRLLARGPRLTPPAGELIVEFPAPPAAAIPMRLQWAGALVGAAGAAVLAVVLGNPMFLAFAAIGPVTMLATAGSDRWSARRGRRTARHAFARAQAQAQERLDGAVASERAQLRIDHPDPAAVRLIAAPSSRIWERRIADPDALLVRIGLGRRAAGPRARRAGDDPPAPEHRLAPIALDLRRGPIGIAGGGAAALGAVRAMLAQLVALHSPADVRVVAIAVDSRAERWRWLRWLPHLDAAADDAASRRALTTALIDELARRAAVRRSGQPWTGPWLVVLVDGAAGSPEAAGLPALLREGRDVGVTGIWLDDAAHLLPESCAAVVDAAIGPAGLAGVAGAEGPGAPLGSVLLDAMPLAAADALARTLAGLHVPAQGERGVPQQVGLVDALGLNRVDAAAVADRWAASRGLAVAIGAGPHGPVELDLERDGPHALIAGTTGAGKSELLQSIVVGLAATRRPADLSFVLVDYKGGAAFAACAGLPHVAGVVTDLDARLAERALRSLTAELRRREAALARAGAKDIAAYRRAGGAQDLPSLVLLVDEFAALAQELPQFLSGLVAVAARGRSLGVHLVLATQRPGGAVSPDIRANTAIRIALRVTDPHESLDVIGTTAAADISSDAPGRGYLGRTGAGAPVAFQAARAAGVRSAREPAPATRLDRWRRPLPRPEADAAPSNRAAPHLAAEDAEPDDLARLIEAIGVAAPAQRPAPPWHPPLPGFLPVHDSRLATEPTRLALGLVDHPDDQAQAVLDLDLAAGGATLIAGGARSGRSTALRTIAAAALESASGPDLYAIDCTGAGSLEPLLPASATVALLDAGDPGPLAAVLRRLADRPPADRDGGIRPALLLIDGIEALLAALEEADSAAGGDDLIALLRRSASVGLSVVATGDRTSLIGRISTAVARRIVLRLDDPADYALAGIAARLAPPSMAPGRALIAPEGAEAQLAALDPGGAPEQAAALAAAVRAAPARDAHRPAPIRALPRRVRLADLAAPGAAPPDAVVLGAGGDDAAPLIVPVLAPGARFVIAGPPGSGRTTALETIARQARASGRRVIALGPDSAQHVDEDNLLEGPGGWPVLIIDDGERLNGAAVGDALARWAADRSVQAAMVVAGNSLDPALTFRGAASAAARRRTGILLQPAPRDGDLLAAALPRGRQLRTPGRGLLIADGRATPVQVALP